MTGLTPKDSDELQKRIAISSQEGKGLAVVDILVLTFFLRILMEKK